MILDIDVMKDGAEITLNDLVIRLSNVQNLHDMVAAQEDSMDEKDHTIRDLRFELNQLRFALATNKLL